MNLPQRTQGRSLHNNIVSLTPPTTPDQIRARVFPSSPSATPSSAPHETHNTPEVKTWLEKNPRFHLHFTPTSASWLNLVEVWFGIIDKQAIRRGVFTSVKDLNAKIRAFITGWNDRKHPFVWTKTADEILQKANRQPTSET